MTQRSEWLEVVRAALNSYQAESLATIARTYQVDRTRFPRKADLINELSRLFVSGEALVAKVATLGPAQVAALQFVAGRSGTTPLASVRTLLRRHDLAEAAADAALRQLLVSGLLLFDGLGQAWKLDLSEHDPTLALRHVMTLPAVARALPALPGWDAMVKPAAPDGELLPGDPGGVLRDMFLLLRSVRARAARLTKQNTLHQADLRRLVMEMRPHLSGDNWKAAADEVTFALSLGFGGDLLTIDEQAVTVAPSAQSFLSAAQATQIERLLAAWLVLEWNELDRVPSLVLDDYHGSFGDVPSGAQLGHARELIVSAVRALAQRDWWSCDSLADAIRRHDPEFVTGERSMASGFLYGGWSYSYGVNPTDSTAYRGIRRADITDYRASILLKERDWDLVEGAYLRQVLLEPLRWLGIVDVSLAGGGRVNAARVTPLGRTILLREAASPRPAASGARLVVQPNFEIVVLDAAASLGLMAQLDAFATGRTIDRAAVYLLTREALVEALQRGSRLRDIERLLEQEGGAPLPQNVRYSLTEWARQFERITLHQGVAVVEADTVEQLDGWLADDAMARLLDQRLGPTTVTVRAGQVGALEAQVRRLKHWKTEALSPPPVGSLLLRDDLTLVARSDTLSRAERARLAGLAEADGTTPRFQLTRASLEQAKRQGWTAAHVLGLLHRRSGQTVPAEVGLKVRGWMGELAAARQAALRLVRLPDPGLARPIEQAAGGVVATIAPGLMLVEERLLGVVGDVLAAYGVEVTAGLPEVVAAGLGQPRDVAGTSGVALQTLRGRALREVIEQAMRRSQAIIIQHQGHNQRSPKLYRVMPLSLDRRPSGQYLIGTIEGGAERGFKLDDIFGIALEETR